MEYSISLKPDWGRMQREEGWEMRRERDREKKEKEMQI
jgi:hypothetical protein